MKVSMTNPKPLISAYSLHAWLAADTGGLFGRSPPGHIRYWDDVYNNFKVCSTAALAML